MYFTVFAVLNIVLYATVMNKETGRYIASVYKGEEVKEKIRESYGKMYTEEYVEN